MGARILKYGQTIGYAMFAIPSGTHTLRIMLNFAQRMLPINLAPTCVMWPLFQSKSAIHSWDIGVKWQRGSEDIAIVASVNCSATAARRIADSFGEGSPNIPTLMVLWHLCMAQGAVMMEKV